MKGLGLYHITIQSSQPSRTLLSLEQDLTSNTLNLLQNALKASGEEGGVGQVPQQTGQVQQAVLPGHPGGPGVRQ